MESELASLEGEVLPNVRLFTHPVGGADQVLLTFRDKQVKIGESTSLLTQICFPSFNELFVAVTSFFFFK